MRSLRLQSLFGKDSDRSRRSRQHARFRRRPQVENMEGRQLLSSLTLNTPIGVLTKNAMAAFVTIDASNPNGTILASLGDDLDGGYVYPPTTNPVAIPGVLQPASETITNESPTALG